MTIPLKVIWLPRPAAKYKGCYPLGFEKMIPEILKTNNFVHLFSGMAKTGFRIDIKEELEPDLVADVHDLSCISDCNFDGGMADPPYTPEFAKTLYQTPYPKWSTWTKEIVRIVKVGGRIGIMQNYIVPRLPNCEYELILVILTRIKQFPKIVTVQKKEK